MHIGMEVEGRFIGVKTLFIQAEELPEVSNYLIHKQRKEDVQQVYVSDNENVLDLNNNNPLRWISQKMLVTVERTRLDATPPPYVNVILNIDCPSFQFLKKHDQFKFVREDRTVECGTRSALTKTVAEDFAGDVSFTLS